MRSKYIRLMGLRPLFWDSNGHHDQRTVKEMFYLESD